MSKTAWYKALPQISLCLLAFTIPFPYKYGAMATIAVIISWLLQFNLKSTFTNLYNRKILWLWVAFFLLHGISYFYSINKGQALFDLESKLSILILPIVIGSGLSINNKQLEQIFLTYVVSMSLISAGCLTQASVLWMQGGGIHVFFYHDLINGLEANAVYEAWYTIFSVGILLFHKWEFYFLRKGRYLKIFLTVLQIVFFILLSSRMLILLFFLFLIPFYGRKAIQTFSKPKLIITALALLLLGSAVIITDNPLKSRYQNLASGTELAWRDDYSDVKEEEFNNLTLRLFLWRQGIASVHEKGQWLSGAGNGDAQDELNEKMADVGIRNMREPGEWGYSPFKDANLHNMYMQAFMMLGLTGFLIMLLIAFTPFLYINKSQNINTFLIFFIASCMFFIQEAALQTQAGIIYYSFFSSIYWNMVYKKLNI